jgi:hypothetical protein
MRIGQRLEIFGGGGGGRTTKVVLLPSMMWYWRTSAVTVLPARAASVGAKRVNGVVLSRYWVRLKLARALRDK